MGQNNGNKVILGATVGVIAGFVAGILLAPKSGKETRQDIKNLLNKAARKVQKEAEVLLVEARKIQGSLSSKARSELEKLEQTVIDTRDKVKKLASDTMAKKDDDALQAAIDDATSAIDNLKMFIKSFTTKTDN